MKSVTVSFEELGLEEKKEQIKEVADLLEKANSIVQELTSNSKGLAVEIIDVT